MNIPLMMTCNACRYARSKSSPATQMIIALVAILLLGPACVRPGLSSPTAVNPTTVKTALGNINGKLCPVDGDSQNNVARFMGIPYGKAKRWSVPTMYNTKYPNHGYNAKQPGAVCMQAPSVRSSVIMSPAAVPLLTDLHTDPVHTRILLINLLARRAPQSTCRRTASSSTFGSRSMPRHPHCCPCVCSFTAELTSQVSDYLLII